MAAVCPLSDTQAQPAHMLLPHHSDLYRAMGYRTLFTRQQADTDVYPIYYQAILHTSDMTHTWHIHAPVYNTWVHPHMT